MVQENTVSGQTYGVYCPFSLKTKTFSLIWAQASEELLWELFVQAGPVGMSQLL